MPYSLMNGMYVENTDPRHPSDSPGYFMGKKIITKKKNKPKVMAKKVNNEEVKKELRTKIDVLQKELSSYRSALSDLETDEVEAWYEKNKGCAFKFKWTESDPEFSGVFRIEGIHEDTRGASWLWLHGTVINTYDKGSIDGVNFYYKLRDNQFLEENKITKAQFNSLLKKAIKKIKLS